MENDKSIAKQVIISSLYMCIRCRGTKTKWYQERQEIVTWRQANLTLNTMNLNPLDTEVYA